MKFRYFYIIFLLASLAAAFMPVFTNAAEDRIIGFSALTDGYWQIWTMNLNQGTLRQISHSPVDKKEPVWFHDRQNLIYRTANANLYILNTDTGEESSILETYGRIFDPALSSGSETLLFTRFREDMPDNSDIWIFDFIRKKAERLTNDSGLQYDPAWSPDNKLIAYVSSGEKNGHPVWVMDRKGNRRRRLTDNHSRNLVPDWSHDGREIVFASDLSGNFDIWKMDSDGKNQTGLTDDKALDTQPVWSPDGREILFTSNRGGHMQIWIMKSDGSGQKALTPQEMKCTDPVWLPR